ncbi:MAG: hypothetical protein IT378_07705 [Sandaracinaceae bacterium]|nr:hypothetical protein [Sandaracinaceae bacterium]
MPALLAPRRLAARTLALAAALASVGAAVDRPISAAIGWVDGSSPAQEALPWSEAPCESEEGDEIDDALLVLLDDLTGVPPAASALRDRDPRGSCAPSGHSSLPERPPRA